MSKANDSSVYKSEIEALRFLFSLKPTGGDRIAHQTARYLDGESSAIDSMPTIRARLDAAIAEIAK